VSTELKGRAPGHIAIQQYSQSHSGRSSVIRGIWRISGATPRPTLDASRMSFWALLVYSLGHSQ